MANEIKCFKCGASISTITRVGRRDECTECRSDIHVCLNCEFYDKSSYNECRETSADVVLVKDRANFCDYFSPGSGHKTGPNKNDLLSAAEALFKKK